MRGRYGRERGTLGCPNDGQECRGDSSAVGGKEWGQACVWMGWGMESILEVPDSESSSSEEGDGMTPPVSLPSSRVASLSISQPRSPRTDRFSPCS